MSIYHQTIRIYLPPGAASLPKIPQITAIEFEALSGGARRDRQFVRRAGPVVNGERLGLLTGATASDQDNCPPHEHP